MSRFVHVNYPTQHPGIARAERAAQALQGFPVSEGLVAVLAFVGAPVARLGSTLRAGVTAWAERRKLAEQDRRLWEVALRDARVMADLSRAMSAQASDSIKKYY